MEEAVHLHDAKGIEGVASPIRAEVASDGLDELTEVLIPSWLSYGLPRPTRSLRMSPSGTDRSWLLEGSDGGTEPALVTGDAGSIFMALWRRDVSAVRGDVEVLRAWSQLSEIF
jgi:hypothetical protein